MVAILEDILGVNKMQYFFATFNMFFGDKKPIEKYILFSLKDFCDEETCQDLIVKYWEWLYGPDHEDKNSPACDRDGCVCTYYNFESLSIQFGPAEKIPKNLGLCIKQGLELGKEIGIGFADLSQ